MNFRYVPLLLALVPLAACADAPKNAAENCLQITLTGTQGGPPATNGQAGAGTLVQYGAVDDDCGDVLLQFDAGRGTTERLSQLDISARDLDAVFLTHLHSDHTEGLSGLLQLRWHFLGKPIDVVCSADVMSDRPPPERLMSCRGLTEHSADAMIHSGEIAQRRAENNARHPDGPAGLVRLYEVPAPLPAQSGNVVWESGDVSVSAIGTVHIAGSLAYRVDTPAGSVVIGGDAGNSKSAPPRESSTSETVEVLASGVDVIVHSAIHPVFAPGAGSKFPPPVYLRQSGAKDLGAMAKRVGASHLVLTHLIPAVDSPTHGPFAVPGEPLSRGDFESAARESGYEGEILVGEDLLSLRLP
ncbi:MAG: MBL fold metallo-hydrolase [Woeseiaceae bacterium]